MRADYSYLVSRYGMKKVMALGKGESLDPNGTVIVDTALATIQGNIQLFLDDAYEMLLHKMSSCYDQCDIRSDIDNGVMFPMFKIWHAELTLKLAEYRRGDCKECADDCDKILDKICSVTIVDTDCNIQPKCPLVSVEDIQSCIPDICNSCGCTDCDCCPEGNP